MQRELIKLKRTPYIISSYCVAGKKEFEGPLGKQYDECSLDNKFGKDTWEKSEGEMQRKAVSGAMKKAKLSDTDIDILFSGDLLNQCIGSNYGLIDFDIPYVGLYGACSTCIEGLALASCLYAGGIFTICGTVTSSHFCASERQFRFPLEYGGQRAPTAQWTVTGSGAYILGDSGKVKITEVMFGKSLDMGISDINNMGAAMAPSCYETIKRYFKYSSNSPSDFDLIATGDLGYEGSEILKDLLLRDGIDIRKNHNDCGLMVFDRERQDVHAGGSGCGCSAIVLSCDILKKLESGIYNNVLVIGTGALMSPMTLFQGSSIPAVSHLIRLERSE